MKRNKQLIIKNYYYINPHITTHADVTTYNFFVSILLLDRTTNYEMRCYEQRNTQSQIESINYQIINTILIIQFSIRILVFKL